MIIVDREWGPKHQINGIGRALYQMFSKRLHPTSAKELNLAFDLIPLTGTLIEINKEGRVKGRFTLFTVEAIKDDYIIDLSPGQAHRQDTLPNPVQIIDYSSLCQIESVIDNLTITFKVIDNCLSILNKNLALLRLENESFPIKIPTLSKYFDFNLYSNLELYPCHKLKLYLRTQNYIKIKDFEKTNPYIYLKFNIESQPEIKYSLLAIILKSSLNKVYEILIDSRYGILLVGPDSNIILREGFLFNKEAIATIIYYKGVFTLTIGEKKNAIKSYLVIDYIKGELGSIGFDTTKSLVYISNIVKYDKVNSDAANLHNILIAREKLSEKAKFIEILENGDYCKELNKNRKTLIEYTCDQTNSFDADFYKVEQLDECTFKFYVSTYLLCSNQLYSKLLHENQQLNSKCSIN